MDVTCERCGTEYDFDETLVSERGTTVKCTNCGHLFKVFRPGAAAAEQDAGAPRAWSIRRRDGTTETLGTLRELQRRITEGALDEEDLISRSGEGWKRLGDIAELETFFEAARAAEAQAAPRRRQGTDMGVGGTQPQAQPQPAPFARSPSSHPPAHRAIAPTREHEGFAPPPAAMSRPLSEPPRAAPPQRAPTMVGLGSTPPPPMASASTRKQTMMGVGMGAGAPPPAAPPQASPPEAPALPAAPPRSEPPPPRAHGRAIPPTAEYPMEELEQFRTARATANARHAPAAPDPFVATRPGDDFRPAVRGRGEPTDPSLRPPSSAPHAARPALDAADEAYDSLPRSSGRGARIAVGAVLGLAVLGGGVALGWSTLGPALGLSAPADPAAPFLARGDEHLAADTGASFGLAVTEYTKALAFREQDPRALAALSRVHAIWAQALRFEAADLRAHAATTPGAEAAAAALAPQQQQHVAEAIRFAESAVRLSPADAEAELVLADAQRLSGDTRNARAHFDRARTLAPDASAEALRIGALLAVDESSGTLGAARELASAAVTRDPSLLRARVLLARALVAAGDVQAARVHLDAVLTRSPRHEQALSLRDALDRAPAPVAAAAAAVPPADPLLAAAPTAAAPLPAAPPDVAAAVPSASAPANEGSGGSGPPPGRDYGFYIERGDHLQQSNRSADAQRYFRAALALRPDGREALTGLGFIALSQNDIGGAIGFLRGPAAAGYGEAMIGMGEAYRKANRSAEALAAYREYLTRFPSGAEASIARRWVGTLATEQERPAAEAPAATTEPERRDTLPAPTETETPPPASDTPAVQGE
jgi:predicted Zn finger-like uncharacterized protein